MSEPTFAPDTLDEATAGFWRRRDLEEIMAGAEPFREDESFEIADLADEEWTAFVEAINEYCRRARVCSTRTSSLPG